MIKKQKATVKKRSLCVVAGSSGGHMIPALQQARCWKGNDQYRNVYVLCSHKRIDEELIKNNSFVTQFYPCSLATYYRKSWWRFPLIMMQLVWLFFKSFFLLRSWRPERVVSTGGLIAVPVCLAARLQGLYVELYELNVVPGKAVKMLAPFVNQINLVFEKSKAFFSNTRVVCKLKPYPLRFAKDDACFSKKEAIQKLNAGTQVGVMRVGKFDHKKPTIFLMGGSQGSLFLNNLLKKYVQRDDGRRSPLQVIHQVGFNDKTDWRTIYQQAHIPALVFSYTHNIRFCYRAADFVVSRAGAGSLFELLFFNKKSIVIPLVARTTDHQVANAQEMAASYPHLFTVLEQDSAGGCQRTFNYYVDRCVKKYEQIINQEAII